MDSYHGSMQAIIGVTARPYDIEALQLVMKLHGVTDTYTSSVRRAGGLPLMIIPVNDDEIDDVLDRLDGIMFTGGGDISPDTYGAQADETTTDIRKERDLFELALARKALERKIPVLAICRGLQIVNVALGGTLVQDLPSRADVHDHDIVGEGVYKTHLDSRIDEGCRLAGIIGAGAHNINSIHHQAVDELGEGLFVVARAADGTIEAIEHEDSSWPLLAVQWHPEFLSEADHEPSNELFTGFVELAAKYRADA